VRVTDGGILNPLTNEDTESIVQQGHEASHSDCVWKQDSVVHHPTDQALGNPEPNQQK